MVEPTLQDKFTIYVIGLGYVGLPVAVTFAKNGWNVIGYDVNSKRVDELKAGTDRTGEIPSSQLVQCTNITFGSDETILKHNHAVGGFYIVTVPTPIFADKRPDFTPLISASHALSKVIAIGDYVVYESTVYPGASEEVCIPILQQGSKLVLNNDFKVGYSPERINPGDKNRPFEAIPKIVSGSDEEALATITEVYQSVIDADIHQAPSLKVAEAAKVIENTQRDVNIALMNELALICDRLDIRTTDVLAAAGSKWNFLPFTPGIVGGHCIGVDPYYLTTKSEEIGYHPQMILAGRRVNDSISKFIANKMIKLMLSRGLDVSQSRIGVLGVTFKENVPDLRNSKVPEIINEIMSYGVNPIIHDPFISDAELFDYCSLHIQTMDEMCDLDLLIYAVPHNDYQQLFSEIDSPQLAKMLKPEGILMDVKSAIPLQNVAKSMFYWSL